MRVASSPPAPAEAVFGAPGTQPWARPCFSAALYSRLSPPTPPSAASSYGPPFIRGISGRPGLVEEGFAGLARRWLPILQVFDECGVDLCYEIHPGEDLHDGVTCERFPEATHGHPRACILYDPSHFVLQCLDYLAYIDIYHEKIRAFHVKDAEFNPGAQRRIRRIPADYDGQLE